MNKELRFLALAGILTALSIALDVLVKQVIPVVDFGLPYYAIPLIIGSIILGPIYGGLMGFVSDFIGFQIAPQGDYLFMFALSAIAWGVIPGLFLKSKSHWIKIAIVLLVTHIAVTGLNSLALYINGWLNVATLSTRLVMLPLNVMILTGVTYMLNMRLQPIYDDFLIKER